MNAFILDEAGGYQPAHPEQIINLATQIIADRLHRSESVEITSPEEVMQYLRLQLVEREQDIFSVMFLDNRHRLIEYREMFFGTIDGASVHPREVVKAALKCNAAALILAHNHPSGVAEPSKADEAITQRLKDALALVDIRILDHIVVGAGESVSFAERGLI